MAATNHRPFRFALLIEPTSETTLGEALDVAKRAEDAGCAIILGTDHFSRLGTLPLLQAVAHTTSLRIGTLVLNNDMRHPVVLAHDLASIDQATGGRLEIGLGAGWARGEYEAVGAPFDPPRQRVDRLEASVRLLKQALGEGRVDRPADDAYPAMHLADMPRSVQRPHPPILVGGGGPRVLRFAAREADIVGLDTRALPDGSHDGSDVTEQAIERKVGWISDAAGARLGELEINVILFAVVPDYPSRPGALAAHAPAGVSEAEMARSPHYLSGDTERMVDALLASRERWAISYVTVKPHQLELLRPVIRRLAGS